jgi:hypothetical protein
MSPVLPWAMAVLETTPERWLSLVRNVPADLLYRPPAPGEWPAIACLHHLMATEKVFAFRLDAFLSGQPSFPDYNPDAPENHLDLTVSPIDLASEFARCRSASLRWLRELAEADLRRTARHSLLGPVTLEQMIYNWTAHDLNHTVQAERALMQPFLAGCGPWIGYFEDHWVKEK